MISLFIWKSGLNGAIDRETDRKIFNPVISQDTHRGCGWTRFKPAVSRPGVQVQELWPSYVAFLRPWLVEICVIQPKICSYFQTVFHSYSNVIYICWFYISKSNIFVKLYTILILVIFTYWRVKWLYLIQCHQCQR